ncbi:hypothetical protein VTL71DRAFT_6992 [Oculimacula yallundae]|uniref:Heterokaryon incompatibility domain-containing protein n=1 Tax=Oculimacula yallundae TaxID=86028 RepID=A0ABR4BVE9_9HELO
MDTINDSLCSYYSSLISSTTLQDDLDKKLQPHHPTTKSLFDSASDDCPICCTICAYFYEYLDHDKSVPRHPERHTEQSRLWYKLGRIGESEEFLYMFYCHTSEDTNDIHNYGHIGNLTVKPVTNSNLESIRKVSSRTDSYESWNLATTWLSTCISSHPKCNVSRTQEWLPTRILDLGTLEDPILCLQTSTSSLSSSYMTLSHCWGKLEIQQLTTFNMDSMRSQIVVTELPKTFQDAIAFTRICGVRYLWIDSLCIVQNSPEDWSSEAARMGDIYKNALCNIAATAALDGRDGCFFQRDPLLLKPLRVRISSFDLNPSPTGLYEIRVQSSFWWYQVTNAPLNQRAWVQQEQVLSTRVIHCGKIQLLWECCELTACEMYPKGFPKGFSEDDDTLLQFRSSVLSQSLLSSRFTPESRKRAISADTSISSDQRSHMEANAAMELWHQIIIYYNARSLTKAQDKLIAISAVAKEFHSLNQDMYLAGMWQKELETELLWNVEGFSERTASPGVFVAPSWSWASVTGKILFLNPELKSPLHNSFMIQILECKTVPMTIDPTGQVSGGYLKSRGWLRSLKGLWLKDPNRSLNAICELDHTLLALANLDENMLYREEEIFTLPVMEADCRWHKGTMVVGILLQRTGEDNQYRRVGVFETSKKGCAMFRRPLYPPIQASNPYVGGPTAGAQGHDHEDTRGSKSTHRSATGVIDIPNRMEGGGEPAASATNEWVESIFKII